MSDGSGRDPGRPVGVRRLAATAELTSLDEVRAAAKDWQRFSSRLQGDPDVRDYPQLPLEVDPPEHAAYRALLEPVLGRRAVTFLEPVVREVARGLVDAFARRGFAEAVHDLAIPLVGTTIAHVLGRPHDAAELVSWGISSWEVLPDGSRSGARIDAYVARGLDAARAATIDRTTSRSTGGDASARDAFLHLASATIHGRPLTRIEQVGLANLVLAGGRDTVILTLCGAMWHLASDASARAGLRADPERLALAIEEYHRYLSPNPGMERRLMTDIAAGWGSASAGDIVVLGWGAANHDRAAFASPGEIRLDRRPNPHVAFGSGPHTCVGIHLARMEARVFLEELLRAVPDWRVGERPRMETIRLADDVVPARFDALPLVVGR